MLGGGERQRCLGNQAEKKLPSEDQPVGGKFQFQISSHDTDQGLVHTRSFAKADGDAVEAKDGEVEHGEADSSKAKPMLCKELESSD